jgi:hypothetical protein
MRGEDQARDFKLTPFFSWASRFEAGRIQTLTKRYFMDKDKFEHILENLQALIDIGKIIKDDLDEEKEEDEFLKSLHNDYNDFFIWAFGLSQNESDNKKKYLKANLKMRWEKLHPEHMVTTSFAIRIHFKSGLKYSLPFHGRLPYLLGRKRNLKSKFYLHAIL